MEFLPSLVTEKQKYGQAVFITDRAFRLYAYGPLAAMKLDAFLAQGYLRKARDSLDNISRMLFKDLGVMLTEKVIDLGGIIGIYSRRRKKMKKKVRLLAGFALLLVLMCPSVQVQAAQWHSYPVELRRLTVELNRAYADGEDLVFNTQIKTEDMGYFLQYAVSTSILEFEDEWMVGTDGAGNGFLYISKESAQSLCGHYEETSQRLQDIYVGFGFTDEEESEKADRIGAWIYANIAVDEGCGADSLYDILLSGKSDCRGIAVIYKNLCDRAGIPCQIVSGKDAGKEEVHLWNRIQLDGGWVNVDATQQMKGQEPLEHHIEEIYYQ